MMEGAAGRRRAGHVPPVPGVLLYDDSMASVQQVLTKLRACLDPREEILEAYVFGSAATGQAQAHSDIDIAVYLLDRPSASAFGYEADLASALMRELGSDGVDVVVLNEAPPLLYHRVLRDGVRILSREYLGHHDP